MELTDEQLEKLEQMSAALMPPVEIAILLRIPPSEKALFIQTCKNHVNSPIYEAYQRGKLTTKFELRQTVVKLAKAGSPAAEPLAEKYIRDQLNNE
ncbi:MAG: hypothetical protein BGN96_01245 [Bacteroidales bacterium 45-6]|nr:MAG: hypothetical protein BGN96_01245 [Bacteroidales bacterium 45-6]